jgi:hypothetical protein
MWPVLAVLVPWLACYLVLRVLAEGNRAADLTLAAMLGLGASLGLASWTYSVALILSGSHVRAVRVDSVIWLAALAAAGWSRVRLQPNRSGLSLQPDTSSNRLPGYIAVAGFVALSALACTTLWWIAQAMPHGNWDALAIWNLRARAISRGVPAWTDILSPEIAWSHPYYPPLLPGGLARLWAYAGGETVVVPQVVATLFLTASVGTVVAGLSTLRGWPAAFVAGSCLIVPVVFVETAIGQDADVPLGFFIVAALSMLALAGRSRRFPVHLLVATGAVAGLAAWTKDEGWLLLVLAPFVAMLFSVLPSRRASVGWLVAGAAPFVVSVLWFKLRLAPPSYLIAGQTPAAIAGRLQDFDRLRFIGSQMAVRIAAWGPGSVPAVSALGLATALLARIDRAGAGRAALGLTLVLGMLAGDALAYLITPLDVGWQIVTSFDRLFLQVWPALVWAAFQFTGRERPVRVVVESGASL